MGVAFCYLLSSSNGSNAIKLFGKVQTQLEENISAGDINRYEEISALTLIRNVRRHKIVQRAGAS